MIKDKPDHRQEKRNNVNNDLKSLNIVKDDNVYKENNLVSDRLTKTLNYNTTKHYKKIIYITTFSVFVFILTYLFCIPKVTTFAEAKPAKTYSENSNRDSLNKIEKETDKTSIENKVNKKHNFDIIEETIEQGATVPLSDGLSELSEELSEKLPIHFDDIETTQNKGHQMIDEIDIEHLNIKLSNFNIAQEDIKLSDNIFENDQNELTSVERPLSITPNRNVHQLARQSQGRNIQKRSGNIPGQATNAETDIDYENIDGSAVSEKTTEPTLTTSCVCPTITSSLSSDSSSTTTSSTVGTISSSGDCICPDIFSTLAEEETATSMPFLDGRRERDIDEADLLVDDFDQKIFKNLPFPRFY